MQGYAPRFVVFRVSREHGNRLVHKIDARPSGLFKLGSSESSSQSSQTKKAEIRPAVGKDLSALLLRQISVSAFWFLELGHVRCRIGRTFSPLDSHREQVTQQRQLTINGAVLLFFLFSEEFIFFDVEGRNF